MIVTVEVAVKENVVPGAASRSTSADPSMILKLVICVLRLYSYKMHARDETTLTVTTLLDGMN